MYSLSLLAALLVAAATPARAVVPPSEPELRVEQQARALIDELVPIETVGGHETDALRPIARLLQAAGIPFQILESAPGRGNLVARVKGRGTRRPLLLLAHMDVVPVEGQRWTVEPFKVTERDGLIYGRGVNDDKGMAAAIVAIALEVKRSPTPLARDLIVALTAGEETGGFAGVKWLLEHHPDLLDAEIGLNEGGGGGIVLSNDLVRVARVGVGLAQKTYQSYRLTATGQGGHSAVPLASRNPVYPVAAAVARVGAFAFPVRVVPAARDAVGVLATTEKPPLADALRRTAAAGHVAPADEPILAQDPVANAMVRTTCAITLLKGSAQENVLPSSAEAVAQCRLLPDDDIEGVRRTLVNVIDDPAVEVTASESFGFGKPVPPEGEVPAAIRLVSGRLWGEVPVTAGFGLGADDGRYLTARGVLVYGVHPSPGTVEDGRKGYRAHGADEHVSAKWYLEGVRWLYDVVLELGR